MWLCYCSTFTDDFIDLMKECTLVSGKSPIHKRKGKNYRPISLLPVLDKIFGKIIYNIYRIISNLILICLRLMYIIQLTGCALLNDELLEVSKWSYQWEMIFNPDIKKQIVEIYFSNRSKQTNVPLYYSMVM